MSVAQHVLTWNDKILDYVLRLKETTHPDLTVVLRKKHDRRFRAGHWFQGSGYINIGIATPNGRANRTKQLGLVFSFDRNGLKHAHLQLDFQHETDPALIACYHSVIAALGRFIKISERRYSRAYPAMDAYGVLDDFFQNDWQVIHEAVAAHGLTEHIILAESEFQSQVSNALAQREARRIAPYEPTFALQHSNESPTPYDATGPLPSSHRDLAPYTREQALRDGGLEPAFFDRIEALWRRKQQLVLQGAPGTGKSYLADVFARYLTQNDRRRYDAVQFHPSYAYEDFVEGLRPSGNGAVSVQPGVFKLLCERARREPLQPFVLLIDEINRGNVSKIFGELLYLLEYRDKTVKLTYQPTLDFGIPPNLFLIATMNTADRSLAAMDHALRRRFAFVTLNPDYRLLRSALSAKTNSVNAYNLVQNLERVNQRIANAPGLGAGFEIGHSYFLKDDVLSLDTLRMIWDTELRPLLDDYFFDAPDEASRCETMFFENL